MPLAFVRRTARRLVIRVRVLRLTLRTLRIQLVRRRLTLARRCRDSLQVFGGKTPVMTTACLRKWASAFATNISLRAAACALPLRLPAQRCALKRRVVGGAVQVRRSIRAALRLRHPSVLRVAPVEVAMTRTIQCHRPRPLVFHRRRPTSLSRERLLLRLVLLAKRLGRSTALPCASRLALTVRRLRTLLETARKRRTTVMEVRPRAPPVERRNARRVSARQRRTIPT